MTACETALKWAGGSAASSDVRWADEKDEFEVDLLVAQSVAKMADNLDMNMVAVTVDYLVAQLAASLADMSVERKVVRKAE